MGSGKLAQGGGIIEGDTRIEGLPSDGAVHGAGVKAGKAELFGNGFGYGRFAGPRRAVDSDDHRVNSSNVDKKRGSSPRRCRNR